MNQKHKRMMFALRAIGPCSNRELASALKMSAEECYSIVAYLRRKGFIQRIGDELYMVTSEGRRELLLDGSTVAGPSLFSEIADGLTGSSEAPETGDTDGFKVTRIKGAS